jgi:hypothetical protein
MSEEQRLKEKARQIALAYKMKQVDKKRDAPSSMTMSRFGFTSAQLKRSDSGQCVPASALMGCLLILEL